MMGFEESTEPPKKKLKQAQLQFCNQLVKSNKRKCTDIADDNKQAFKMICKDVDVDTNSLNKENVFVNNTDSQSNDSCMQICDVATSNSIDIKESNSDPKENSKSLAGVAQSVDESIEISSSSDSTNEHLENCGNENQLEVELKNDDVQVADTDDKCDKNIIDGNKADIVEINSDDEYAMETDVNINCNDISNKSQSFSISSDDEKSDTTQSKINNSNVTPPSSSENELKRKLTPKSLEKRKQRESIKLEKLQQKEKEKEAKLKMKMEKEEQKRREKEEKEEQKRKEREEKEKKKLAELKQKEDERRLKEEEKKRKEEAKEEEKRLKEEERRRKEEAKEEERKKKEEAKLIEQRKEEQAKKAFTNFFILKKSKADNSESIETNVLPKFMPFPVKPDMTLAVAHRRSITNKDKTKLEAYFNDSAECNELYLTELKNGQHTPHKTEPTWPVSDEQHDVIIIESVVDDDDSTDEPQKQSNKSRSNLKKAKLLQFHENRRPAYWGTWRKKSDKVTPRRPFDKDDCLNYEVESDLEWEDEGEGEDIDHEDDSDKEPSDEENCDEKNENGYILDNTFVPHGYLSDEEIEENEENFDPEDHKLRLKVLKEEFEEEMKTKAERLKPRLLGCVWISNDTTAVSKGSLYEILMNYRAVWNEDNGPIKVSGPTVEESPTVATNKSKQLPPLVMEQLVKFVHGNHLPFIVMVQEFRSLMDKENYPLISKRALSIKIKEIAGKEFDENGKYLWSVNIELCNEYGLTPLSQMNSSCNIEKSKDTFLDNFLKRPSVSPLQPAKASTPIQSAKSGSSTLSPSVLQPPSTPMQSVVKKRATLITLPQTPVEVNKTTNKVHKDTPRPLHPFFKNIHFKEPAAHNIPRKSADDDVDDDDDDVIDLCDN